ncbi:aminotransferase class V-fold PLP-dependent enzyme, partial [Pyramidobacter porci]
MSIYFNNAATTWPKPDCVAHAMSDFLGSGGANLWRGTASVRDLGTMGLVLECRERAARLLGGYENASPVYVTFTANVTESLNIVLKGFLKPGMRVVTTSMEHNAVTRPLRHLEKNGVELEILPCDRQGY